MLEDWKSLEGKIDQRLFSEVESSLSIQVKEAKWWKDACLLYFRQFSGLPFPEEMTAPSKSLDYFMSLKFPYAPGIKPEW